MGWLTAELGLVGSLWAWRLGLKYLESCWSCRDFYWHVMVYGAGTAVAECFAAATGVTARCYGSIWHSLEHRHAFCYCCSGDGGCCSSYQVGCADHCPKRSGLILIVDQWHLKLH